jgi:hypothetical protein
MSPTHTDQHCTICGTTLEFDEDHLSRNCGGDCWGCIGLIEAQAGCQASRHTVDNEIKLGLRDTTGQAIPNPKT